jgi:peptide-methionine (S)-S-oxide reductase
VAFHEKSPVFCLQARQFWAEKLPIANMACSESWSTGQKSKGSTALHDQITALCGNLDFHRLPKSRMGFSNKEISMLKTFTLASMAAAFLMPASIANAETAVFAGGCFWCVESDMDSVKGVTSTVSGYAGGTAKNPTYESHEGHAEAVKIEFDPNLISYEQLTSIFLRTIDVTDGGGQFCDRGSSYVSAVFPMDDKQKAAAKKAFAEAEKALGQKIVTPIIPFTTFGNAEDYHQNYYKGDNRVVTRFGILKQSDAYKRYRKGCGRDAQVKAVWGAQAYEGVAAH